MRYAVTFTTDPNYIYIRNVDDIDITINDKGELQ